MSDYEIPGEVLEEAISDWYDLRVILSMGAYLMFVIGERSAGKTYSFKQWAFETWLKARERGEKPRLWAYIRRNEEEISIAKRSLWNDYLPERGWDIKTEKHECFIRPHWEEEVYEDLDGKMRKTKPEEWEPFGYFFAISEAQDFKGAAFPLVDKACLDEFIIENPRRQYIPGEVDLFMGLLQTIFRRRKGRVVCLSNSGAIVNPYFKAHNVDSSSFEQSKWVSRANGKVMFEYYTSNRTTEEKESDFIFQIASEEYRDYAFENNFMDSSTELVTSKPRGAKPLLRFTSDGKNWFTLHQSSIEDTRVKRKWISSDNSYVKAFALSPSLVSAETVYDRDIISQLKAQIDARKIAFDSPDTRARFLAEVKRA